MYIIEVHQRINQIFSIFYFMRLWSDYQPKDIRKRVSGVFILGVFLYTLVSATVSAITCESSTEQVYLAIVTLSGIVMFFRLYHFFYRQDEILELTHKMCVHSFKDRDEFNKVNATVNFFAKIVTIFNLVVCVTLFSYLFLPFLLTKRALPIKVYHFPLNWKENDLAYWVTYIIVSYVVLLTIIAGLINTIMWYLMMSCVIKYKMLGNEFRNLGLLRGENIKLKKTNDQETFLTELVALIKKHRNLQKITDELQSCFAFLFFLQIGTSGLNICCALYNLGFNLAENVFVYICFANVLVYEFFDIFVITYYGDEIKSWSSRLSYSLFECNWLYQSEKSKTLITILMEVMKKPQVLVIGILYPLDLETFTNILNFAYSTFNILRNWNM